LSLRTLKRWTRDGEVTEDRRPSAARPTPPNALSEAERGEVLAVCNSPDYASLPPSQIVPRLADQGIYIASESTFYRVLRDADAQHRRGRAKAPRARRRRRATPPRAPTRSGLPAAAPRHPWAPARRPSTSIWTRLWRQCSARGDCGKQERVARPISSQQRPAS
jgi:hypothetical protein